MKIAYFLDIPYGLGGAGNLLLQQAGLISQLHDVIVVIPGDENGKGNEEYINRCKRKGMAYKVLYYETSNNFLDIDYIKAVKCKKSIEDFVIKEDIKFLHSVQLNIAVEMVARERHIPHLMDIYQLREEEFALAYTDIYPHYHLCDSELYAGRWGRMLGITSKCIRPGAPLDKIKFKEHSKREKYRVVMLGEVSDRKNQLVAIKAVEKCLEKYDIILEIAGNMTGIYGGICRKYVQEHTLGDRMHFLGFVSDISSLLEKSDCLLCTSTDESFPSSIVEAVTYDLTIISTPVAGVPEVFTHKYNAYISTGYREEEVCQAIIDCMEAYKDGSIVELHKNVHDTWNKYFLPDRVRADIIEYYAMIMEEMHIGEIKAYESISLDEVESIYYKMDMISENAVTEKKRALYYYFLKQTVKGKVYIWGAGKLGRRAYELIEMIDLEVEVIAFIDKERTGKYCGRPIIKPNEINYDKADYFFISFAWGRDEVTDFLQGKGYIYNQKVYLLP